MAGQLQILAYGSTSLTACQNCAVPDGAGHSSAYWAWVLKESPRDAVLLCGELERRVPCCSTAAPILLRGSKGHAAGFAVALIRKLILVPASWPLLPLR